MFSKSTFGFHTSWGDIVKVTLTAGQYQNGAKALQLIDTSDGGPYAIATVNTGKTYDDDQIVVKDWSENEGMVDFLTEIGFIDQVVGVEPCGYALAYICHLSPDAQNFFASAKV